MCAFHSYLEAVLKSVGIQFSEGLSFTFCFSLIDCFHKLSFSFTSLRVSGQPVSASPEMGACCSILHPSSSTCPLCRDSHTAGSVPVSQGARYENEPKQSL